MISRYFASIMSQNLKKKNALMFYSHSIKASAYLKYDKLYNINLLKL